MKKTADGKPQGPVSSDDDRNLTGLLRIFEGRLSKSVKVFDKRLMNSRGVMREISVTVKPMAETSQKRLEKKIGEFDNRITALIKEVKKLQKS